MNIYKNIKKIAKQKNLTIKELAYISGMQPISIYRYKHGTHNPRASSLQKIADVLGVTTKELMQENSEELADTVFKKIKKIADKKGLSIQDVSQKAELSRNTIYQYNGTMNPTEDNLKKIADALGVTPADLQPDTSSTKPRFISKAIEKSASSPLDLDTAIDSVRLYNNQPITDDQRTTMKNILKGYLDSLNKQEKEKK